MKPNRKIKQTKWTKEKISLLLRMRNEGYLYKDISKELGVTLYAVQNKAASIRLNKEGAYTGLSIKYIRPTKRNPRGLPAKEFQKYTVQMDSLNYLLDVLDVLELRRGD